MPSAHSTSRITAMVQSMAGSLSAPDRSRRRACDRVSVNLDEHHGGLGGLPDRPGDRGHGPRARIDPVPRARRRPAPARARRPLAAAFGEPIRRERAQHLFRPANPTLPLLRPGHPALRVQIVERGHAAVHLPRSLSPVLVKAHDVTLQSSGAGLSHRDEATWTPWSQILSDGGSVRLLDIGPIRRLAAWERAATGRSREVDQGDLLGPTLALSPALASLIRPEGREGPVRGARDLGRRDRDVLPQGGLGAW